MPDYSTYLSPFTWRYGSTRMRKIWSEEHKRHLWRQIWVALAEVQAEFGLLDTEQVSDLRAHVDQIDIERALEIEAEVHHDLMAELMVFSEQCPSGGGVLHLGATSMDIEDNADTLRLGEALDMTLYDLRAVLLLFVEEIDRWAKVPLIGFTHLQPAEPSSLGYRLAQYAQDLLMDWENLWQVRSQLKGKGFKGAVGTAASYGELVGGEKLNRFEARLSERLTLPFFPVATQTYPRKQDYQVISALAGLGGSLYKFAFDLRVLQSPPIGELAEPFTRRQVGSSAMPFKRNPIRSEKIDSLARALAQMPRLAWDNAAHQLLERSLDDSANRRTLLPEAFLITDELLRVSGEIIAGLRVDESALARNLAAYGPFAATERILMALGKAGADRQVMHERLRVHAMKAWEAIARGETNPLPEGVYRDDLIRQYLEESQLQQLMDVGNYTGNAPQRAKALADTITEILAKHDSLQIGSEAVDSQK
jgi:adenylosuccinate lyase